MGSTSRNTGRQIAALPVRLDAKGQAQVCLITSRSTKRWIIPKGWPMKGIPDHRAAAIEALEEAGLRGKPMCKALGSFRYWRRTEVDFQLTEVTTFLLHVTKQSRRWKEINERAQCWLSVLEAADRIQDPELSTLIATLPSSKKARQFLSRYADVRF